MNTDAKRDRGETPRYYRIACRFWSDDKVAHWPDEDKLLALYLLTNRHRTVEGLYVLPIEYIAVDLGWNLDTINATLARLVRHRFVKYDHSARVILVRNALKYQTPELPNVVKGVIRRLKELPRTRLLIDFFKLAKQHCGVDECSNSAKTFISELQTAFPSAFASTSKSTSQSTSSLLISSSASKLEAPTLPVSPPRPREADGRALDGVTHPPQAEKKDEDNDLQHISQSETVRYLQDRARDSS